MPQAEALGGILADEGEELDGVVYFAAGREILVLRLAARRICRDCGTIYNLETMPPKRAGICDRCGGELYRRRDDMPRAVEERLREYEEKTADLAEYYRRLGLLIEIDAEVDKDETFDELKEMMSATR